MMTCENIHINTPPPYLALTENEALPTVLSIAGSDSSGGAGLEADLKTITANRCYGMTCTTALTVQTPKKVYEVYPTPKNVISKILDANLADMRCDAIKTGMLTIDAIEALVVKLKSLPKKIPLIVDPVMVATSGTNLAQGGLIDLLRTKLAPLATLLTPNIPEAFKLVGQTFEINSMEDALHLTKLVAQKTNCGNILLKGGHLSWHGNKQHQITDILFLRSKDKFIIYKGHHIDTSDTHGTGCTLASAITSNIARGYSLEQSIYGGIEYVQNAVRIGCQVTQDHVCGNGPINHVYGIEIPLKRMLTDECFDGSEVISSTRGQDNVTIPDFFEYLINDPMIKPHWESYIKHDFVKQIANGTLAKSKFQSFVEQDYSYLVDYARVHCLAASKAPTFEDLEKELVIVGSVRNEMKQHEKRLLDNYGVRNLDNIKRQPALKNYARYFNDVAKRGDWCELIISLAPCLMGYGYAIKLHQDFRQDCHERMYYEWCETYSSEWYRDAMNETVQLLNYIGKNRSRKEINNYLKIFAQVCELETRFWDAVL